MNLASLVMTTCDALYMECDKHSYPARCPSAERRRLPTGGDGAIIVCHTGYLQEMAWRRARNRELTPDTAFALPRWQDLTMYHRGEMTMDTTREITRVFRVPAYGTRIDEAGLRHIVADAGNHFFDPAAMRGFHSRLHDIVPGVDGWYFITSERFDERTPRFYTLRRLTADRDVRIDALSDFQQYPTLSRARTALRHAVASAAAERQVTS